MYFPPYLMVLKLWIEWK